MEKIKKFLKILGPGVITGAADDDPSGIATYSQTGAQFGFNQLWLALYLLPFMTSVQEVCARIGAVKQKGLAGVIKDNFSKKIAFGAVALVLIANTINIGADIGAMSAAARLLIPIPFVILTLSFTAIILILEIFTSYKIYSKILKWLAFALLSYPITVFLVKQNWYEIIRFTLIPQLQFNFDYIFILTGVIGTTISPYLFFWEASEEVEEEREKGIKKEYGKASISNTFIRKLRVDNALGMVFSEIATWSIIIVGASVLHMHGVTNIQTAADAAKALEPLVRSFPNAGFLARFIFAVGIIGLGLLSIPVLSGSAAYALSEVLNWKEGLNLKLKSAHGFYGIITISTILGLIINFIGIDPVKALVYAAVINGIVAVPLLFLILKLANKEGVMGKYKSGLLSNILVSATFIFMLTASVFIVITAFHK